MTSSLEDEVRRIVASMDNDQQSQAQDIPGTTEQEAEPEETIHIHYFPDAIVILKEDADTAQVVDSTPIISQKISFLPAYAICIFYLFLILSTLAFQFYEILNPPIATINIIPKSQQLTLNGTLQLGRLLQPITISQSQTTGTTGRGHQSAKAATGTVIFYNGLFTQQFIASGTVYTGLDGVEIITTQDATIPPGNPNSGYGTLTVTAQALLAGSKGNIQAGDIDITINNGLLVRNNEFHNGQDERNFQTVRTSDIASIATPLKSTVLQSMTGAFQGQLKTNEQLSLLPCSPTVTPNHNVGDKAIQVQVTVSETCSAVAYDTQALQTRATELLTTEGLKKLAGYSLFGEIQVSVKQVSVTSASHPLVFLSFKATETWIYGLSYKAQQQIKQLIAGKTKQQALLILLSLPGIEQASIRFQGFGDATRLPKQSSNIHVILFVV